MKNVERSFVAVFDAGTTGVRAIIFDTQGSIVGRSYEEYPTISEVPGQSEQNPDDWWRAAATTMQRAIKLSRVSPSNILAVSVCTQRATLTPIDKEGTPIYRAITWMDTRVCLLYTSPSPRD